MNGSYKLIKKDGVTLEHVAKWPVWLKLKASLDANGATYSLAETAICINVVATGGKAKRSKPVSGPRATLPTALKQAACVKAERKCVAGLSSHYYSRFTRMPLAGGKSWESDNGNPAGRATFSLPMDSQKHAASYSETAAAFRGPWSDLLTLCRDLTECGIEFQASYQNVPETGNYSARYGRSDSATPTHVAAILLVSDRQSTNKALEELVASRRADLVAGEHEYWQEMASLARDHETAPTLVLTGSGLARFPFVDRVSVNGPKEIDECCRAIIRVSVSRRAMPVYMVEFMDIDGDARKVASVEFWTESEIQDNQGNSDTFFRIVRHAIWKQSRTLHEAIADAKDVAV